MSRCAGFWTRCERVAPRCLANDAPMKHHLVVKLAQRLPDDALIPDWLDFISDKSYQKESLTPEFDRLMRQLGFRFWVASEYKPRANDVWKPDETTHGLDRTYRVIFQDDDELPDDLIARISRLPAIEEARRMDVAEAPIPAPSFSTMTSVSVSRAGDLIFLPYAHALTRGSPDVRIAVLDTGVNLDHQELQ